MPLMVWAGYGAFPAIGPGTEPLITLPAAFVGAYWMTSVNTPMPLSANAVKRVPESASRPMAYTKVLVSALLPVKSASGSLPFAHNACASCGVIFVKVLGEPLLRTHLNGTTPTIWSVSSGVANGVEDWKESAMQTSGIA